MCVRCLERIDRLVLINSVGVKFGGREERDIADIYALPERRAAAAHLLRSARAWRRITPGSAMTSSTRSPATAQATALYGWRPYMHNPGLRQWLHRVRVPTLVIWGENDGIVTPDYGQKLCRSLPDARFEADQRGGALPADRAARRGRRSDRPFRARGGVVMKVWHFSEMAYHPAWPQLGELYRVTIPSRLYDPKVGADLYHRYLDEWALCDELGINIMTNEHHATATCANSVCTIPMAILARETKKVRLLALGMPIGNRNDPIRVAEEYSMLDVISRGRIEMGFVKGVPFEISPANTNPADLMERFWEAHDLILKAMTSHDGPFNWEGTHFHYRSVNVWPRPWQQPHPPVWMPVGSPGSAMEAAERGMTIGVLNTGWVRTPADLRGLPQEGGRGRAAR